MRPWTTALALFAIPLPAFAEVCDKENEAWNLSDGPIGYWPEVIASATSHFFMIALFLCLAVALTRHAALHLTAAILLGAGCTYLFGFEDSIAAAARREGCLGPASASIAPFLLLAVVMLARGWKNRRKGSAQP